jgi:hypothetical protein
VGGWAVFPSAIGHVPHPGHEPAPAGARRTRKYID